MFWELMPVNIPTTYRICEIEVANSAVENCTTPKVPFNHAVKKLPSEPSSAQLIETYETLLHLAKVDKAAGHNVLIVKEWMLVIPRRQGRKGVLSANAAAMAGMVWVIGEEEVRQWVEQGPMNLLCEFGVVDDARPAKV